jgi:hypothetical protein
VDERDLIDRLEAIIDDPSAPPSSRVRAIEVLLRVRRLQRELEPDLALDRLLEGS